MGKRTRLAAVLIGAAALLGTGQATSHALAPTPTCIRECSPVVIDTTGPCYGVVIGNNRSLDNFCYLGPPPPA